MDQTRNLRQNFPVALDHIIGKSRQLFDENIVWIIAYSKWALDKSKFVGLLYFPLLVRILAMRDKILQTLTKEFFKKISPVDVDGDNNSPQDPYKYTLAERIGLSAKLISR